MKKQINKKLTQRYTDFVYGVHGVLELLSAKRRKVSVVYTTKKPIKAWSKIQKLIPKHVSVSFVSREALGNMTSTTDHQGVVAFVSPFPYAKQMFTPSKQSFILVLDGIQDVGNLGAIIRSAYCAGVDGVVLTKKNSAPLNAAAVKASAGLAEHVAIFVAPTINFALQELQKQKYNIYLATLGKGENAAHVEYAQPTALVIGSEGEGIAKSALKMGTRILLPQRRADISYNASVAAGILLFVIGVQVNKIS